MTRFYFNLDECGTTLEDVEGREYSTLEQAMAAAIDSARDVMAGEIRAGRLCLGCCIRIIDDDGKEVGCIAFNEAVEVSLAACENGNKPFAN